MDFQPGDNIFFAGYARESLAISFLSCGIPGVTPSHVGKLAYDRVRCRETGRYRRELLLFESTTLTDLPCEVRGIPCHGVQAHKLADRVASYRGKIWHCPLRTPLTPAQSAHLTKYLHDAIGLPYDAIGAFRAGGYGFSKVESWLRPADLHSLFCSELCVAADEAVGIADLGSASKWSPAAYYRALIRRHVIAQTPTRLVSPSISSTAEKSATPGGCWYELANRDQVA